MYRILIMLTAVFALLANTAGAAVPTWKINPSDFEYSMTVTAVLNVDGVISSDTNDLVAAYAGNELRGVVKPDKYTTPEGYRIVFLQIYSNVIAGEKITFKMYKAKTDKVWDAVNSFSFLIDSSVGKVNTPFIITTNSKPTDVQISPSVVNEESTSGSFVGKLSTVDPDGNDQHVYSLVSGDGDADNSNFIIRNDSIFTNTNLDFRVKTKYTIRVKSDDQKGESIEKILVIEVAPGENRFVASEFLSPNNDGVNDVWKIENIHLYAEYEVIFFASSGAVVYRTKNYQNDWKGTSEGKLLPTGAYYFLVQNSAREKVFRGSITLVNE